MVRSPQVLQEVREFYQKFGPRILLETIWRILLRRSGLLKLILGTKLHEKVVLYPRIGYWPHLEEPRSFNEKVAHRKLYSDDDKYSIVSDKYRVRKYVRSKGYEEILNEIYLVTSDPEEISFENLPSSFVVKATHGSGHTAIVEEKHKVAEDELRDRCQQWLNEDFGRMEKEYWYEDINPQIIIEEYIDSDAGKAPIDYKFFVFHGEVEIVQVDQGRFETHKRVMYDRKWDLQEFTLLFPQGSPVEEPPDLERMINIAEKLGNEFDFVRVDLYNPEEGEIRFGEMTLAPGSGEERFTPVEYDFKLGSYWQLE